MMMCDWLQLQAAKHQQQLAEEERLQSGHSKGRQAVERSNSKSIRRRQSHDPPSSGLSEQLVALSSKHEQDVTQLSLPLSLSLSVCVCVCVCARHGRWNRGSRGSSCSPNFWHGEQAIVLAPLKIGAFWTAMSQIDLDIAAQKLLSNAKYCTTQGKPTRTTKWNNQYSYSW